MISEIANSLFLTYLFSEYLVPTTSSPSQTSRQPRRSRTLQRVDQDGSGHPPNNTNNNNYVTLGFLTVLVGIANLLDHHYYLSVVWEYATTWIVVPNISNLLPQHLQSIPSYFLWMPAKFFLAASSYVLALYVDIHRDRTPKNQQQQPHRPNKLPFRSVFLPKVGWAFLKILPAYPFLAVLISFLFLFVVDLWEALHLPMEWLNNPIYYGTLYGPFAYTYIYVKREVVRKHQYDYYENYDEDNHKHNKTFHQRTREEAMV